MSSPKEKLIEMEASVQQEKDKFGLYFGSLGDIVQLRKYPVSYPIIKASLSLLFMKSQRIGPI